MKKKSESVYRLHIDAQPHIVPNVIASPESRLRAGSAKQSHHRAYSRAWSFLWDKIKFILVSIAVFAVIFIALNWQALWLNVTHYYNVWRGYESPLTRLAAEETDAAERLPGPDISAAGEAKIAAIAPLNLEIYPPDMRIVIPRINQNVPVVGVKNENLIARQWDELEADIQKSLRNGVIHYPGTALPGENGNVVITGHSSYYAWDPGRFKDVFALLHDVKKGDKIVIYFNQKKYIYEVDLIKVVLPKDVDVLGPSKAEQITLITCTPIGTNLKRLIVQAKLIEKR